MQNIDERIVELTREIEGCETQQHEIKEIIANKKKQIKKLEKIKEQIASIFEPCTEDESPSNGEYFVDESEAC